MRVHLRACARCARHIRITEGSCPFCGAAVDASMRSPPPVGNASLRLRRAAAVAAIGAAAGTVAILEGCSGDVAPGNGTSQTDVDAADAMPIAVGAAYGLANTPLDAGPDADAMVILGDTAYGLAHAEDIDATPDADAQVVTGGDAYGAPPSFDATPDAEDADAQVIVTGGDAYGAPPSFDATPDLDVVTGGD